MIFDEHNIKIETFRADWQTSPMLNVNDVGVRVTHLPTGTVAEADGVRSQRENRAVALARLAVILAEKEPEAIRARAEQETTP